MTDFTPNWPALMALLAPIDVNARLFARRIARSVADGDDLYHEAVLRAARKLPGLRDPERFSPWLHQVIVSVHRSRCRREFWRRLVASDDPATQVPERATEGDRHRADTHAGSDRAARALAALPAVQREAIVMHEMFDYTVEEIAVIQRCSPSAVKSQLVRGRKRLRAHYDDPLPAAGTKEIFDV